jgi:serine O-acetyltransferase
MERKVFFESVLKADESHKLPTMAEAANFVDAVIHFMFPYRTRETSHLSIDRQWHRLHVQLTELLCVMKSQEQEPEALTLAFFEQIPKVYEQLLGDANEILLNDPAADTLGEVILAYPGFYAIAVYRIAHELYALNVPILPRLFSEYAHSKTGIDIHPGATIGNRFFIDHGTGIVIGETALIGDYVKIYQGVTLGALSVKKEEADSKRHPTIEDRVTIYSNSTILGGETSIGHDSLIGGNVFLTFSVPPFSTVYHKPEIRVRQLNDQFAEAISFVI